MSSNRRSYSFISKPDANSFCAICLDIASQPKQCEDCGKLFCSECIENNGREPCPNCRTDDPKYFKDVKSKLLILLVESIIMSSFRQERDQCITSEMCQH